MRLHRAEGFLYTKHPVARLAPPITTRDATTDDDGETFGYAYTAHRFPRPIPAVMPKARGLKLVFGYAYTARYERIHDGRVRDDRMAA